MPSSGFDLGTVTEETKLQARIIVGDSIFDTSGQTRVTDEVVTVKRLLGPLEAKDVPILRCVGLNYAKHIKEAGRTTPPFPFIFFKPSTTVIGHDEEVHIPEIAQDDQADYEGELVSSIHHHSNHVHGYSKLTTFGFAVSCHWPSDKERHTRERAFPHCRLHMRQRYL